MAKINELPRDNSAFWNPFEAPKPIDGERHDEYILRVTKAFQNYANDWFKTAGEIMAGTYGRGWPTHYSRAQPPLHTNPP